MTHTDQARRVVASAFLVGSVILGGSACLGGSEKQTKPDGGPVVERHVPAEATGISIKRTIGDHLVAVGPESARVGKLWVFLPGTGARPDLYRLLALRAAALGYHSIHLSYANTLAVNRVCPGQGETCAEDMRREIVTGRDTSRFVEVDPPNSIEQRLASLLAYLSAEFPDEGWERYLDGGVVRWDLVTVAGHSQGGGHAAFIGKLHLVERVVLFSAAEPALWTTQAGATPPDRYYGFAHELEDLFTPITRSWDTLGLPPLRVDVDAQAPPYQEAHRLVTGWTECRGDIASNGFYHNCGVVDDFTPFLDDGVTPRFQGVWDYLIGAPPQ